MMRLWVADCDPDLTLSMNQNLCAFNLSYFLLRPHHEELLSSLVNENCTSVSIFRRRTAIELKHKLSQNQRIDIVNLLPKHFVQVLHWHRSLITRRVDSSLL